MPGGFCFWGGNFLEEEGPLSEEHISARAVVYRAAGADGVKVRREVEYAAGLTADIYYPPDSESAAPAVFIVAGFPDEGFAAHVGRRFKEMGSSVSWARLMAAEGLAAVTYTNRAPAEDLRALLAYVRLHADELRIDRQRLGLWASSGNVPLALSALMEEGGRLKCAALCYGYMLDSGASGVVAEASRRWGFVNPCAGRSAADLPAGVPLFVARAGRDEAPGLNEALDRFASAALACNLPLTLVNHPEAPHAFDLLDDSEPTREVVRRILAFLRFNLKNV